MIILQAADRGLSPPTPPGLARPSGPVSLSSNTTAGRGKASLSSGMPTPNSPAVGSPRSQPGQQFQGTTDSAAAFAPAARGGFGSGLRPEMLKRLGNGDGKPFGEHASGPDRGQGGDRQAGTNRPGLSNNVQTALGSQDRSGSGVSDRGRGGGRHATGGGPPGGRQQPPPGGRHQTPPRPPPPPLAPPPSHTHSPELRHPACASGIQGSNRAKQGGVMVPLQQPDCSQGTLPGVATQQMMQLAWPPAAQRQAAAVLCSEHVALSRQASVCRPAAHIWDPVSQKQ